MESQRSSSSGSNRPAHGFVSHIGRLNHSALERALTPPIARDELSDVLWVIVDGAWPIPDTPLLLSPNPGRNHPGRHFRLIGSIPDDIEGNAFGKIYEYCLGNFAMTEGHRGRPATIPDSYDPPPTGRLVHSVSDGAMRPAP